MNCKYYKCDKVAQHPYPACGITHGMFLKEIKSLLETKPEDLTGFGQSILMKLSPEELAYYKSIN